MNVEHRSHLIRMTDEVENEPSARNLPVPIVIRPSGDGATPAVSSTSRVSLDAVGSTGDETATEGSSPRGRKIAPREYVPLASESITLEGGSREEDDDSGERTFLRDTAAAVGEKSRRIGPTEEVDQICIEGVTPGKLPGTEFVYDDVEEGHSCDSTRLRMYELWPGKNRFFFHGHCMTGGESEYRRSRGEPKGLERCVPSISLPSLGTWFCILAPSAVYFVLAAPKMWNEISPALPLATALIFLLTVISLLTTCLTDPGILPRRDVVLACKGRQQLAERLGYDALGLTGDGMLEEIHGKDVEQLVPKDLREKGYRWCRTCHIVKPPRSAHCSFCDNCVMRFDHHCPFVNNCVGQRNYLCFFGFTSAVTCLSLFVIPSILWYVIIPHTKNPSDVEDPTTTKVVQWLLIIVLGIIIIAVLMVMGLWGYHTFLILSGKTTKEHLKGIQVPYIEKKPTLFAARGPRMFDQRAVIIDGILNPKKQSEEGAETDKELEQV